jgi:hypothetical protein
LKFLKNNLKKMEINTNMKCWGQVFPVSAYGKADGVIKVHIQEGIAPYRLDLKINGNFYRSVENIPQCEFNYVTYEPPDNVNYADCNCVIEDLPPGAYTFRAYDSTPEPEGPQEVRVIADWNAVSPPFATLNGEVNPVGLPTTVSFEYGLTTPYEYIAEYGVVNGTETVHCSLQLSSGGYDNTSVLVPGTTYHFRIKAVNANGEAFGEDLTFVTPSALPVATTLPATNIS